MLYAVTKIEENGPVPVTVKEGLLVLD